jgi:hypothetical protein
MAGTVGLRPRIAVVRCRPGAGVQARVQRVDGGTRRLRSMLQGRDRGAPPAEASTPATRSSMGGDLESSLRRRAPPPPRASAGGPLAGTPALVSKDLGRPAPGCVCGGEQRRASRVADRRKAIRRANRVRGPVPGWVAQRHARGRPSYSRAREDRAAQRTPRSGAPQSQPGAGRPRASRHGQHAAATNDRNPRPRAAAASLQRDRADPGTTLRLLPASPACAG